MTTAIAVVGAGLVGRRHVEALRAAEGVHLAAIADSSAAAREVCAAAGVPLFDDLSALLASGLAEGVILATPNQVHFEGAMACIRAGVPVLVEKPLTENSETGGELVAAADAAGVPLLVGHHRRHNGIVRAAQEVIGQGRLGRISTVHAQFWLMKPAEYFDTAWRRSPGGGPVWINLIHDVDLMQALLGPIVEVEAWGANTVRGHPVEETVVALLRFAGGVLGTVNLCDAAAAPWSWELTARENDLYAATDENCLFIGGTEGSLALPHPTLWAHPGRQSWWEPITATRLKHGFTDSLVAQAAHFGRVIRGEEAPVCSGADGLAAVRVVEAILASLGGAGRVAVEPAGSRGAGARGAIPRRPGPVRRQP